MPFKFLIWAASWQIQQYGMCAQRRLKSSLSAWRKLGSLATHWAHSEDSDQTGRMPRLIWVFAGHTVILLVLSRCSFCVSFNNERVNISKVSMCYPYFVWLCGFYHWPFEPPRYKTNIASVRPAKTQISLGTRPVWSESSLCAQWVAKGPSCGQQRLWSDCADARTDLSLRWAHTHFIGFVTMRLISCWVLPCSLFSFFFFFFFFFLQSCLALWSPRLGKKELVYVLLALLFVSFERFKFCPYSFPLGVRDWLRFVLVALPGLFY